MNTHVLIGLGLVAQSLFSARFLIQLIRSEKAGKVVSPVIFWQLSLFASFLLMVYGTFRQDIVIVGGQLVGYLVYIRNLQIQKAWDLFPKWTRFFFWILPLVFFLDLFYFQLVDFDRLIDNPDIDVLLLTWGSVGQVIFTARFVVQWYASEQRQESYFPREFWYISIVGALSIAVYALVRKDAVLFIGQAFGLVVYGRNLWMDLKKTSGKREYLLDRISKFRLPLLLIVLALVLFFNLGAWSVTESSEARYAQISKEMLESGDWIHPSLMGIHHYHKPPFTYWITAISYQIFGVSAFSARFFLQLAVLVQVFLVYKLAILLLDDRRKAFLSAMIYASIPVVIVGSRALTTDAYLTAWVLAGIYFWLRFKKEKKPISSLLSYVCYGFGFLTKGPVVWIIPIILEVSEWIRFRRRPQFGWVQGIGWILMLGIGLSWFGMLMLEDSQFFDYFVFRHTVERFASDSFSRSQPFWYYWLFLIGSAFPWFILLIWKSKSALSHLKSPHALAWIWVIVALLFFSVSKSKLVLYILPLMAGLAIGSYLTWEKLSERDQKLWEKIQLAFHLILLFGLLTAPFMESRLVLNYKFWFIWILTFSTLLVFFRSGIRQLDRPIISAFVFTMGLTVMSTYFFPQNPELGNDTRRVVEWLEKNANDSDRLVIYDKRLPSISFQSEIPLISVYDGDESLNRETQFEKTEDWRNNLINLKEYPDWIHQTENQNGIWMAKSKKKLPTLSNGKGWVLLAEVDGWRLWKVE
ncbi:lipid-A-disaccharide synthase N-terminal domain-containing protein [Algoriphagus sp.]|uniref:lipid-A-disaccharide synthase N-terminal domain-containing protein n=1 Tax=Algoriphagus sp. TaxID=1872435 RepID=UPI00391BFDFE